jgi:hypothetical protein
MAPTMIQKRKQINNFFKKQTSISIENMSDCDQGLCMCKTCSCGKHKLCKPQWAFGPKLDAHSGINQMD